MSKICYFINTINSWILVTILITILAGLENSPLRSRYRYRMLDSWINMNIDLLYSYGYSLKLSLGNRGLSYVTMPFSRCRNRITISDFNSKETKGSVSFGKYTLSSHLRDNSSTKWPKNIQNTTGLRFTCSIWIFYMNSSNHSTFWLHFRVYLYS